MSFNIIAYSIYLLVTVYVTVVVGYGFHKHGHYLILDLFNGNEPATKAINNMLLVGYYLVNIGYLALSITTWPTLVNWADTIGLLFDRVSIILILLGLLHVNNIVWLHILSKRKKFIEFITH